MVGNLVAQGQMSIDILLRRPVYFSRGRVQNMYRRVVSEKQQNKKGMWFPEGELDACESGMADSSLCTLDSKQDLLEHKGQVVMDDGPVYEAWSRGKWLLGLLVLQSTSSVILDNYQELLKEHLVVTLFLTMLVGAGGNAGNQSAIKIIRGLATGLYSLQMCSFRTALIQQTAVAFLLGSGLSLAGFVRVYLTNGDGVNAIAISSSLFFIVFASVVFGTSLPFALAKLGIDPANAGTSIQVIMDILGVAITCVMCNIILSNLATTLAMNPQPVLFS